MQVTHDQIDQAKTLRSMKGSPPKTAGLSKTRDFPTWVLSVTSGKGGVGKTAVVANLAVTLGQAGKKVLIIDADLGLANIDVVFGLTPKYNLNHFFAGQQTLDAILVDGPSNIKILPAGSGVQQFTHLDANQKMRFINELDAMHGDYDIVLIDTEAGISDNVTYFNMAAQDILVITSPEPTAITDAYALMKLLSNEYGEKHFKLIVNSVTDENEALDVFRKLTVVSNRYLNISLDYLGGIPFDKRMHESIRRQKVIVELYPTAKPSAAFRNIAENFTKTSREATPKGSLQFFWKSLLAIGNGTKQ
jgi:flagellar biosynthesis protein FlhG